MAQTDSVLCAMTNIHIVAATNADKPKFTFWPFVALPFANESAHFWCKLIDANANPWW